MDPQACFIEMMDAFQSGDLDTAREHAEALVIWMQHGGFPPCGRDRYQTHRDCYRVIRAAMDNPGFDTSIVIHTEATY